MELKVSPTSATAATAPVTVAVAGSTGAVGRHVVAALERRGHPVRHIARAHGVDLLEAEQVSDALEGVAAVVDVAGIATSKARPAADFFDRATTNLLEACHRRGVRRYVLLSIVGVDRVGHGYYAAKLEQERTVQRGGLEHVVLRATQFHEFAAQMWERMRAGPVVLAPRMRCATVAAEEVAERLAELATASAPPPFVEMGGPAVHWLPDLVRAWGRAAGRHALVLPVAVPGAAGRSMRSGGLLPARPQYQGVESFAAWLARTYPTGAAPHPASRR